jgi:archaellum biogenesis ATPase FlaH
MMVSLTIPLEESVLKKMEHFGWVNWSEVAREEIIRKEIFERYLKNGKITDEDWIFCDNMDWHPVDELPVKKEYVTKLKKISKAASKKMNSAAFEKWCESV